MHISFLFHCGHSENMIRSTYLLSYIKITLRVRPYSKVGLTHFNASKSNDGLYLPRASPVHSISILFLELS